MTGSQQGLGLGPLPPMRPAAAEPATPSEAATCAALYDAACGCVVDRTVRAYGIAFTGWMTGRPVATALSGPKPEQHQRIAAHFRRVLTRDLDAEVERRMGASPGSQAGRTPPDIRAEAHRRAQALFLRGQYRVNLLFFYLLVQLERSRKHAAAYAALQGAAVKSP